MKRVFTCFSFFALAVLIALPAFASTIDYGDPANNPTSQTWFTNPEDFPLPQDVTELPFSSGPSELPMDIPASVANNPYGMPVAHFGPGWELEWTEGWGGPDSGDDDPILTWHFAGLEEANTSEVGTITFEIPNNPENNPFKEITWSLISDKAPQLNNDGFFVSVAAEGMAPDGYTVSYPMPQPGCVQLGGTSSDGGVWYQYSGVIRIEPNPMIEYLTFDIYECTNIAEFKIETVCVPEPGTLLLLISGFGLLFVARRIK